jgi:hypothetical protein
LGLDKIPVSAQKKARWEGLRERGIEIGCIAWLGGSFSTMRYGDS